MSTHVDTTIQRMTGAPSAAVTISPFRVLAGGATDRGKVREQNEDHFVVAELTRALRIQATSLPQPSMRLGDVRIRGQLFIVADGMGGHRAGERASALAVVTIEDFLLNTLRWFFQLQGDQALTEFQQALRTADERIFEEASHRPELRGMGTTVTMAYASDSVLYVVHVGDSRLYVMRGGRLHQVTRDHTVVGELVQRGLIDAEQAAHHPMRNVITNSVGGDQPGLRPEVHKIPIEPSDVVLLCSDGLTEMVADDDIAAILVAAIDPQEACDRLVIAANAAGGADNITAIVAQFASLS